MKTIEEFLIHDEGEILKPYFDCCGKFFRDCDCVQTGKRKKQGKLTIGVGRNIEDKGISRAESRLLLDNDIKEATHETNKNFPWLSSFDEVRKMVVTMMMFNMGTPVLLEFKKFLASLKEKDWDKAKNEMLASKWAGQVKSRAVRFAEMIRTGIIP